MKKKLARNLLVLGCAGSPVFAAPFLAIGDNAELFVTANVSAAYSDNILLTRSNAEEEDVIFTFRPGLELQFGKDSQIKGEVVATSTLKSYVDNDYLNSQLFGVGGNATYENGRLSLRANASFNQLDQATIDVVPTQGKLVERHVTSAGLHGEYELSQKFSVGTGFSYNYTDYKETGYTSQWDYVVPVNVYYELTPKVDLSAGVRYVHTDLDRAGPSEYDAFYYNVGARGSFTPKLSGSFSVGYNTRTLKGGPDDDGGVGAEASLAYAYSEKTRINLSGGRNFSNASAGGASYENTHVTLSATNALTVDWRLSASLTYRKLDYQQNSQVDDYIEGSVGATYIINSHFTTSLSYTYRDKSSDAGSASEFQNNRVALSLSARY